MRSWKNLESPTLSRRRNQDLISSHLLPARSLGMEPRFFMVSSPLVIAPSKHPKIRFVFRSPTHHASHLTPLPILSQLISTVIEQDVEMDDTSMDDDDPPSAPSPDPDFGSAASQGTRPQLDVVSAFENEIAELRREKAVLMEKEEYVLRKLSRNGQGTVSNIETVTDRAVRQRDDLRAENQELWAVIERLKSDIIDLQSKISHMQDKLDRAESERIEMAHSKRRWISRMWALAGRVPGELRKKDADIENMKEKLVGMHARLAQGQSDLRELQGQLDGERVRRIGVEAELEDSRTAHAQVIKDRDLAGRRLRDQLNQMANSLDSGTTSI
jgi:predicted  nucleic acid-binding Zn-ribbon protein